jgi:hypothetical protein
MGTNKSPQPPPCSHRGEPVQVGPYTIYAGGLQYFQSNEDLVGYDILIPLTNGFPMGMVFGQRYTIMAAPLVDYGGVPPGWRNFLEEVVKELKAGKKILAFCVGSHGRTGCFLGSLIALLEKDETMDPLGAVWDRHCDHAVETLAQAEAIFQICGKKLPPQYVAEYSPPPQVSQPPTKG